MPGRKPGISMNEDAMGEFAIGQPVPRFEDPRLIKGGGRYIADMTFPGTVFGYVLRSPHAHARIRKIDTTQAKAAPGVLAVITGADYKAAGFGDLPVPGGLAALREQAGWRLLSVGSDRSGRMIGYSVNPELELALDDCDPAQLAAIVSAIFV